MVTVGEILRILGRLPAALFRRTALVRTDDDPPALYDIARYDQSRYDDVAHALVDEPPQFAFARMLAAEAARVRDGWREARVLQYGAGRIRFDPEAGGMVGERPHATGKDMDRLGEGFGIGRPYGFRDLCYWRLIQLMLFSPGPNVARVVRIAELYTGVRPEVRESPGVLTLIWPRVKRREAVFGAAFVSVDAFVGTVFLSAFAGSVASDWSDTYARSGPVVAGTETFTVSAPTGPCGMLLDEAVAAVRPAGVWVDYVGQPLPGTSGCLGEMLRRAYSGRGRIAAGPGDLLTV